MTVARRRLRKIEVDGVPLLWTLRMPKCGGCPQDPRWILVVDASREGAVVRSFLEYPYDTPVTPAFVAETARLALAQGWTPGTGSGYFRA